MADVFISYARNEVGQAREVCQALEALGLSVFFDLERLDAGDEWPEVLDLELGAASAVIGVWSPYSLSRPWVRKECAIALKRRKLFPVVIEPITDLDVPAHFASVHRLDFTEFNGSPDHADWRKLVRVLARVLNRKDLLSAQIEALKEDKQTAKVKAELDAARRELHRLKHGKTSVSPFMAAFALAAVLVVALAGYLFVLRERSQAAEKVRESFASPEMIAVLNAGCDHGNAVNCYNLGVMNLKGTGMPRDYAEAKRYLGLACKGGNPSGCRDLGTMFSEGLGGPQNSSRAQEYYKMACDYGEPRACWALQTRDAGPTTK